MHEPTHASWFSGVGGLDMGLERVGWRTVAFSEIDPYASAVLAERWPGIPNLGDITTLGANGPNGSLRQGLARGRSAHIGRDGEPRGDGAGDAAQLRVAAGDAGSSPDGGHRTAHGEPDAGRPAWADATLWSGGFPCQDLSVAGKRRGMGTHADRAGTRSGLAFAFLDLVERYRPPAILLENVPGLFSSHAGKDFGALIGRLAELGYVGAYRVLDARHFGVPQRRRRVFIVALDARRGFAADSAAEVLSVGSRCRRHPPTGVEAGPGAADGARPGVDIARAVTGTSGKRHDDDTDTLIAHPLTVPSHGAAWKGNPSQDNFAIVGSLAAGGVRQSQAVDVGQFVVGPPPDAGRVRAPDGLAGRLDDLDVVATLNSGGNSGGFRTEPGEHIVLSPTLRVGAAIPADGGPGDTVPIVAVYRKATKAHDPDDWERWEPADISDTLARNRD